MSANAEAIAAKSKRAEVAKKRAASLRKLRAAEKELERLERQLSLADKVDDVVDGVALSIMDGHSPYVTAVGEEITRAAEWYPNAHNDGKTWGLRTWEDAFGRKGEKWYGADWPNELTARAAAIAWVVSGESPASRKTLLGAMI